MLALRHKESDNGHKYALAERVKDNMSVELKYQVGQAQMLMIF